MEGGGGGEEEEVDVVVAVVDVVVFGEAAAVRPSLFPRFFPLPLLPLAPTFFFFIIIPVAPSTTCKEQTNISSPIKSSVSRLIFIFSNLIFCPIHFPGAPDMKAKWLHLLCLVSS